MRHGSLFSGIGGFDLAAQWMNWTNVFHTEWNEFGQKVLQHHFPNSISYHDIIKTDYTIHNGDIEIITGGFPCQPFSLAGKRKGTDDERYLWHEMLRAIQQIQPTYVVAENVRGLLTIDGGMVFEQVCADLEAEGYEVQPILLPAAGVNAPHRRDRIFIVGYAANTKDNRAGKLRNESGKERTRFCNVVSGKPCGLSASTGTAANTDENGNSSQGQSSEVERDRCRNNGIKEQRQQSTEWTDGLHGFQSDAANTMCSRRQRQGIGQRQRAEICDTNCCSNAWQKFPTQSPICGGDDGIPDRLDNITFPKWRNESIKAYGNAVVPQLILPIFQTIEKLHREKNT
jgi:DNA (cytosine-5)-methyltransferase 1